MGKGFCSLLAVAIVSVFAGAFAYELLRKTEIAQRSAGKISKGFWSARKAFKEGYQSAGQPLQESP
jgi:hypothetical protein